MKKVILPALLLAAAATPVEAQSDNRDKMNAARTRVENITNYNTPRVSTQPVNRITPSGTQTMTPNAPARTNTLRTTAPPPPRTVQRPPIHNPTNDPMIRAGATYNTVRHDTRTAVQRATSAAQDKYRQVTRPAQTTTPTTNTAARTWPGPSRTATNPAVRPSTTTATAPARSTSTYTTSSVPRSTTTSTSSSSSSSSSSASKKR